MVAIALVVLENITRLYHADPAMGSDAAAARGVVEVGPAILAATLSFIALFAPFLLVPGLTTLLFKELIFVIAGIVCISLLVAMTLVPMLSAMLLKKGAGAAGKNISVFFFEKLSRVYGRLLSQFLRIPRLVTFGFVLVLAGAVFLFPKIGSEFLPQMDDGRIMVKVKLPTGASVHETDRVLREVEKRLDGDPLIESAFTLAGGKVWGLHTYEIANEGEVNIQLVSRFSRDMSTKAYVARLRPLLSGIGVPGGKIMVMQAKVKGLRKMGDADIEVKIQGSEIGELFSLAEKTAAMMGGLGVFTNVYVSLDMAKPEYQVLVDRVRATELGISVSDVGTALRSFLTGAVATRFREGDDFYNVRVMLPENHIHSREGLENLVLDRPGGGHLQAGGCLESCRDPVSSPSDGCGFHGCGSGSPCPESGGRWGYAAAYGRCSHGRTSSGHVGGLVPHALSLPSDGIRSKVSFLKCVTAGMEGIASVPADFLG